ncbi:hypothetical protein PENARI_c023G09001 [Penicillium arizonense]|uniref:LysM domain-containing protein n=1 Tax=Penicillium arizonense TaxID=1835702 RepID=A0A1F5L7X5_PENAI|nr:hypothetical protein PENARI_c023G09001 [Penicillium arizonense]OGE49080.1 hypothetical protein PENARI_c023G09001 [Penicillium arizonense]
MKLPISLPSLVLLVSLATAPVYSVQLWNSSSALPDSIPLECRNALSTNITCPQLVSPNKVTQQVLYSPADLTKLCGNTTLSYGSTNTTGTQLVDPLVWAHNVTCLQNSKGFCNPQMFNSSSSLDACSDCVLSYVSHMLESDYGRVRFRDKSFSSQLSSCGVPATKYPYTTPTSAPISSSTVSTSVSPTTTGQVCNGDSFTVSKDDTCKSIAEANSIPYGTFLADNGIDQNCTTLKTGSEVCLSPACTLYTVKEGDTCKSILQGKGFYKNQLLSWNPTLRTNCDNLKTMVDQGICISPPGSSEWDVVTTNRTSTMTFTMFTGDWETGPPPTPVTESPTYTALPTNFTSITSTVTINQTAQSIIGEYSKYCPISDEDYEDGFQWEDLSDSCQDLLDPYCNPDIDSASPKSTNFPGSCTPTPVSATTTGTSTPTPSPTLPGTASKCSQFYYVVTNDTCPAIVEEYGITLKDFYSWNPGVGSDCRTLKTEYYVCVAVSGGSNTTTTSRSSTTTTTGSANPSPTQNGVASNCDEWHYVKDGDGCFDLSKTYDITLDDFYSWNPAVGDGCKNLNTEYYVCVGVNGGTAPSTTTQKPTSTGDGTTTNPTETLPGTIDTCKKYYKVANGDGCYDIAAAHDITLNNFYSWNPSVKDDCSGLKFDSYVCVGI